MTVQVCKTCNIARDSREFGKRFVNCIKCRSSKKNKKKEPEKEIVVRSATEEDLPLLSFDMWMFVVSYLNDDELIKFSRMSKFGYTLTCIIGVKKKHYLVPGMPEYVRHCVSYRIPTTLPRDVTMFSSSSHHNCTDRDMDIVQTWNVKYLDIALSFSAHIKDLPITLEELRLKMGRLRLTRMCTADHLKILKIKCTTVDHTCFVQFKELEVLEILSDRVIPARFVQIKDMGVKKLTVNCSNNEDLQLPNTLES